MKYLSNLESVKQHKVPKWFDDAKVGIFIHWGIYSVPAWANPTCELGEADTDGAWYTENPYAEWYCNTMKLENSSCYKHHVETYGKDFKYEDFIPMWKAENFDADKWAAIFKKAGAKYVVDVTKHHDGFCLWNSKYTDYNTYNYGPKRDIIDELNKALKKQDIKFGFYYSGLIDWSFAHKPVLGYEDLKHPDNVTYAYADYAYNQVMELIDKYKPSILWNDIGWPIKGESDLPYLLAHYYNTVEDGVINDRYNDLVEDFFCMEYKSGTESLEKKWEMCRGIGLSFGYNQVEDDRHLLNKNALVTLLIRTVSHNGNLLLNIGPRADGTIDEKQVERLEYMGAWLEKYGEAIYATRIYNKQQDGENIYYTQNDNYVYCIIDHPENKVYEIDLPFASENCEALADIKMKFSKTNKLQVELSDLVIDSAAVAFRIKK